jgi:hypothetical protein
LQETGGKSFGFMQNYRDSAENLLVSRELQELSRKSYRLPANLQETGRKPFGFLQRKQI